MIYEFALEPELVASWVDRAAYRFFDGKFGVGQRRIASAFPAHDRWRACVLRAFDDAFASAQPAARQAARQRLGALLVHICRDMAERQGTMPDSWREAVAREHVARPYRAILETATPRPTPPALSAEDIDESSPMWSLPTHPTPRTAADLVAAVEPVLRFCREVRLVDPHVDPAEPRFRESLVALLRAAQQRRNPESVRLELHTGAKPRNRWDPHLGPVEVARRLAAECEGTFAPVLARGTALRLFVWSEGVRDAEKIHNRYILTNLGSISVPSGLDAHRTAAHTDDLTILTREQHAKRWGQYCQGSPRFRCVLGAPHVVRSTA
jgi:hypothetical protein